MNKRIVASCAAAVAACAASAKASDAPWVYLPTESVISNDNAVGKSTGYVLKVKVRDAAKHALAVGNGGGGRATPTSSSAAIRSTFPNASKARRFSAMYSDFDFLDMSHMLLVYHGAQYLTNGPLSKEPAFLVGCTLF